MLLVAPVKKERQIPMSDEQQEALGHRAAQRAPLRHSAVTHIDYSARVQTVSPDTSPDYYDLIKAFEDTHGLRRAREHLVQRPGRAHRLHPGGRVPLLHAHHIDYLVTGPSFWRRRTSPNGKRREIGERNSSSTDAEEGRKFGFPVAPRSCCWGLWLWRGTPRWPTVFFSSDRLPVLAGLLIARQARADLPGWMGFALSCPRSRRPSSWDHLLPRDRARGAHHAALWAATRWSGRSGRELLDHRPEGNRRSDLKRQF
jgi:hypothetical protein